MKDHEKRELINKLLDIAVQFAHTQQLRQRIAEVVLDALAEHEKEQEPVAWMHTTATGETYFRKKPHDKVFNPKPVYTTLPQREWQGLTVEEAVAIYKTIQAESSELEFAKAIEAKLKEKNAL